MKPIYQILEYGSFITGREIKGYETLPPHTFAALRSFLLQNADGLELMGLSARKGIGDIITAKNYVGVIVMADGTTIEILPKICGANVSQTKQLLVDMLKTLPNTPYKTLQTAGMHIAETTILEVFIRMFLDEVFRIVKYGLKCGYERVEENLTCCKGKLKFTQQLRYNYAHQERSFVEYDSFQADCPENRILKATLQYLQPRATSNRNRKDIQILLNCFGDVDASVDTQRDLARCVPDRHRKDYTNALMWSRVFLQGKSFTTFSGSEVAMALLFPMETLFESYVATQLKKRLDSGRFTVSLQDGRHCLFDKQFPLRPDIVVTRKADGAVFLLDTKWKRLSADKANYGISQADMYQMYAYQKKYNAAHVTLLYPKTDSVTTEPEYHAEDGVTVRVRFVDLFDIQSSMERLCQDF